MLLSGDIPVEISAFGCAASQVSFSASTVQLRGTRPTCGCRPLRFRADSDETLDYPSRRLGQHPTQNHTDAHQSFKDTAAFRKGAGEAIAISACLFPGYLRRQAPIPFCFELSADDDEPPRAIPWSLYTCLLCSLCCANRLLGASWCAPSYDWVVMHCRFGLAFRSLLSYVTCFAVRPPCNL